MVHLIGCYMMIDELTEEEKQDLINGFLESYLLLKATLIASDEKRDGQDVSDLELIREDARLFLLSTGDLYDKLRLL